MTRFRELVLELTDCCPQHCLHCSSDSGVDRGHDLPRDLALRLVDQAAQLQTMQISFGGGEPLSSPFFFEVLSRVIRLGIKAEVFTCGVTLSPEGVTSWSDSLVERFSELTGFKLVFSLHGATHQIHDYVSQVHGSFHATLASLDKCSAEGIHCELNFVPLRQNASAFGDVVALALEHGVKKVSILRFVPQGRGQRNRRELELSRSEETRFVRMVLEIRKLNWLEIRTGSPFNGILPGNAVPCRAGAGKLVVQPDGNVLPCEVFKHERTKDWGLSVLKDSLCDIAESPRLLNLRAFLGRDGCLSCPVHGKLAHGQRVGTNHAIECIPETAVLL